MTILFYFFKFLLIRSSGKKEKNVQSKEEPKLARPKTSREKSRNSATSDFRPITSQQKSRIPLDLNRGNCSKLKFIDEKILRPRTPVFVSRLPTIHEEGDSAALNGSEKTKNVSKDIVELKNFVSASIQELKNIYEDKQILLHKNIEVLQMKVSRQEKEIQESRLQLKSRSKPINDIINDFEKRGKK